MPTFEPHLKLGTTKKLSDMRWRGTEPRVVPPDRKVAPTADAEKELKFYSHD